MKVVSDGARTRFKIRADDWATRCKAAAGTKGVPFECPHLKAVTRQLASNAGDPTHKDG